MRYRLAKFFEGRNGNDALARALLWAGVIVYVLAMVAMRIGWTVVSNLLSSAALVLVFFSLWRTMSRNLYKRSEENQKFLAFFRRIKTGFSNQKTRFSQRKDYKFFKCPACKSMLRVPRGKGKIQITCRKCGNRFSGKT